jgi:hypothetical protein
LAVYKLYLGIGIEQWLKRWELLLYLKQRLSLKRCSYSENPFGVYSRFLVLISIALGCLGWDNDLVDIYGAVVLY